VDLSRVATGAPWEARGIVAARVARPADAEEVARLLAECAEGGKTVLPVGGGTALASGGLPTGACGLALVLDGMSGVVEHAPDDLTLTARAGTSFEEVRRVVGARGQRLPGLPAGPGTLGGLVASGWTAATAREVHGALRERVIGSQVAESAGRLTRSGGRVVKNVTGYDLHRMHAGAGGALGVLTELAFRLEPLPERLWEVSLDAPSWSAAQEAWLWLARFGPETSFCLARAGEEGEPVLTARIEGDEEPAREGAAGLAHGWGSFGSAHARELEPRDDGDDAGADPVTPERAIGPARARLTLRTRPSRALSLFEETRLEVLVRGLALDAACLPRAGEIRLALAGRAGEVAVFVRDLAAAAARGGPAYRVEDEWPALPPDLPRWSADPAALRLLARVKRALDPAGILRPGSYSAVALERAAAFFEAPS